MIEIVEDLGSGGSGGAIGSVISMVPSLGSNPTIGAATYVKEGIFETDLAKIDKSLQPFLVPYYFRDTSYDWLANVMIYRDAVVKAKTGVAICGIEDQGIILKSVDSGVTWVECDFSNLSGFTCLSFTQDHVAYNPTNNTWMVLGGDSAEDWVARSTDNGVTWAIVEVNNSANMNTRGSICHVSGNIWIILANVTYRSTNDGATWTQVDSNTCQHVAANGDGSVILAITSSGAVTRKSTDSGATWSSAGSHGLSNPLAISWAGGTTWLASDSTTQLKISTDDGVTWKAIQNTLPSELSSGIKYVIHYEPVSDTITISTSAGYIARSKDTGTTWEVLTRNAFRSIDFDGTTWFGSGGANAFYDGDLTNGGVAAGVLAIGISNGSVTGGTTKEYLRIK
ncbi:MAG: exo-alpha-sialidase [Alcanivoracaceae bacterium]|nr:exo-alpha-sialidase [Alcanivoracaceae bacterium]